MHHFTALPLGPVEEDAPWEELLGELQGALEGQEVSLLREVLFGEAALAPALESARRAALAARGLEPDLPWTLVGCTPCRGGGLAGVQVFGVSGPGIKANSCTTLRREGRAVGRLLEAGEARLAVLSDVNGLESEDGAPSSPEDEAERMFRRADELAQAFGFSYRQVARSWIYIQRLLDWYGRFNSVRDQAFRRFGLITPDGPVHLPASTGIQGAHPAGAECFMDMLLMDGVSGAPPAMSVMRSGHQCEASDYGSSFARGIRLELGGAEMLLVSGTASINLAGETVHLGDGAAQIRETLSAVDTLLKPAGAGPRDIAACVAFCKTPEVYRQWQQSMEQAGHALAAAIPVLAHVCRDDLLFELEPTAVVAQRARDQAERSSL